MSLTPQEIKRVRNNAALSGAVVKVSALMVSELCDAAEALLVAEQRNRELTRQVEQLMARVDLADAVVCAAMDLKNGLHWDESCAGTIKFPRLVDALTAYYLTAPPSSAPTDPGRADTGRDEK